jgi:MoxR-like ATPase
LHERAPADSVYPCRQTGRRRAEALDTVDEPTRRGRPLRHPIDAVDAPTEPPEADARYSPSMPREPETIDELQQALAELHYVADRALVTSVFLALRLGRPLLLEGEAGVGKTELAKALASTLGARLIRLQCYEGLDVNTAVYEWNYPRQMLEIRLLEAQGKLDDARAHDIFAPRFLLKRPLLQALEVEDGVAPVLLIDEIDRADEEFEAFLLEILSDFQVTIPEIGTLRAERPPRVILTSNRTREVHDALKRRCLYHWIDYPDAQREYEIVLARVPDTPARLAAAIVAFVQRLRVGQLTKVPGVAETIDWAAALLALGAARLTPALVDETLGVVLKYEEDVRAIRGATAAAYLEETAAGVA